MPELIRTGILHSPTLDLQAGEALRGLLRVAPSPSRFVVTHESHVGHDRNWCEATLCRWCDEEELDLVLTVGGTFPAAGPDRREIVPEATGAILDRMLPGLGEAMRAHAGELSELALLDRGLAGIRSRTLIVNLPGGAAPATLFLEAILHLLAPVVAHLHHEEDAPRLQDEVEATALDVEEGETDESLSGDHVSGGDETQGGKLDADEFAAFLRRPRT